MHTLAPTYAHNTDIHFPLFDGKHLTIHDFVQNHATTQPHNHHSIVSHNIFYSIEKAESKTYKKPNKTRKSANPLVIQSIVLQA